jgi:hypothetical protein
MIIVTANVGLLPFEIGKKRAYITDKRVGFFNSAGAQLNPSSLSSSYTRITALCERLRDFRPGKTYAQPEPDIVKRREIIAE